MEQTQVTRGPGDLPRPAERDYGYDAECKYDGERWRVEGIRCDGFFRLTGLYAMEKRADGWHDSRNIIRYVADEVLADIAEVLGLAEWRGPTE